jgi:hypothetical protein
MNPNKKRTPSVVWRLLLLVQRQLAISSERSHKGRSLAYSRFRSWPEIAHPKLRSAEKRKKALSLPLLEISSRACRRGGFHSRAFLQILRRPGVHVLPDKLPEAATATSSDPTLLFQKPDDTSSCLRKWGPEMLASLMSHVPRMFRRLVKQRLLPRNRRCGCALTLASG